MYKITGTGTRGRGHWDACVGTCDSGTRDERLGDIKYGTRGCVGRGRGTSNTGTRGKRGTRDLNDYCNICDFSHFPREYVLVKATHLTLLTVPPCRLRSEDSAKTPCIEESETTVLSSC